MNTIYLDYAATTPVRPEVLEEMLPCLRENFGNPDSLHACGRAAAYAVTKARDKIAEILGADPSEVYFTSGGTEADNWAVRCLGKGKALLSPLEHAAALSAAQLRKEGFALSSLSGGQVHMQNISEILSADKFGLLAVMAVNNETGCIQPIEELSRLCREKGVLLFSDCVQAACSQDLKKILSFADSISLSGHKIGAPKGIGVLVVKRKRKLYPLLVGGEQERGLRGGTLNVAGAVGFAKALELAQAEREAFCAHTRRLRDLFEEKVLSALGGDAVRDGENRAPNLSHLTFRRGGEAFLSLLDLNGIAASGGAACSAHASLPSHVMMAMGKSEEEARRGVRFSFGRETTEEETLQAAKIVIRTLSAPERLSE